MIYYCRKNSFVLTQAFRAFNPVYEDHRTMAAGLPRGNARLIDKLDYSCYPTPRYLLHYGKTNLKLGIVIFG